MQHALLAGDDRHRLPLTEIATARGPDAVQTGWELVGVQPLWPAETSYLIFKRPGTGDTTPGGSGESERESASPEAPPAEAQTQKLEPPPTF